MTSENVDLFFWFLARITGLSSFLALFVSVLSGIALRTSVLDWLANNRSMKALHTFSSALWIPLGGLHLLTLLVDRTAKISPLDLVLPFAVDYGGAEGARQAIGLGTLAFDIFVIVTVTSWIKKRMQYQLWSWIHRSSYVAFAMTFAHAFLSGTDFNSPVISSASWSLAFAVLVLALSRVAWGRLPT
jgi:predicted ferric reductase